MGGGATAPTNIDQKPQRWKAAKIFLERRAPSLFSSASSPLLRPSSKARPGAEDRTGSRHQGVVPPEIFVRGSEDDEQSIEAARSGDYGHIDEAERKESDGTKAAHDDPERMNEGREQKCHVH